MKLLTHANGIYLTTALLLPATHAGGCSSCLTGPCGRVRNLSTHLMKYTTNPNPALNAHTGRCHFQNWYNSNPLNTEDRIVSCSQKDLTAGNSKGGCSEKVDVDGFTFPDRWYYYGGEPYAKGVWTKLSDLQTITCRMDTGDVRCTTN